MHHAMSDTQDTYIETQLTLTQACELCRNIPEPLQSTNGCAKLSHLLAACPFEGLVCIGLHKSA